MRGGFAPINWLAENDVQAHPASSMLDIIAPIAERRDNETHEQASPIILIHPIAIGPWKLMEIYWPCASTTGA